MNIKTLTKAGINYNQGVSRFLGDNKLYERVLLMFLEDKTLEKFIIAKKENNENEMFNCIHSLKGATGNLDMENLYKLCCELTETMRGKDFSSKTFIFQSQKLEELYNLVKKGIKDAIE